jgi:ABC-type multidrug transport system fused ATPase/permease subunit
MSTSSLDKMEAKKPGDEDKAQETETEIVPPGKLLDVLRTADAKDKWFCLVGVATAVVSGANQPVSLIIFGNVLNSFNTSDEGDMESAIELLAVLYVVIAVQMFITQFLQTACMTSVAATQTKRIREDYFRALIVQPISFFDSKDQGALATSVMESTLIIQDGIGELWLTVHFLYHFPYYLTILLSYANLSYCLFKLTS